MGSPNTPTAESRSESGSRSSHVAATETCFTGSGGRTWEEGRRAVGSGASQEGGALRARRHMRQTNTEAYMHNRLRVNAARHPRANLLIDYLRGERYCAEHLVDLGLCTNPQGWEPSHAVFGPVTQAEKYDQKEDYVRPLNAKTSKMDDTSTEMQLFLQCMENTYGKFERLSDDEVKKWVPPDLDNIETGPRNLWIDVFGVFNFVTLYQKTGNYRYLRLAGQLVHFVLMMWVFALNLLSRQADEFRELNVLAIKLAKAVQPIFLDKGHNGTYLIHPAIYRTANRTVIKEICVKWSSDAALGYVILGYLKFDAHRFDQGVRPGPNTVDEGLSLVDEISQYRRALEDARFETQL
ncbi:hypothetical protein DL765_004500 [Monosporascus sp. GIB2]|nr:hypothetical protein DL765_004500 [Monosporascus sp. GIB2]